MKFEKQTNANIRLAFEAFAQFSSKLHKCTNNQDLNGLLKRHLKYLFNFTGVRISYYYKNDVYTHLVEESDATLLQGNNHTLSEIEIQLVKSGIPFKEIKEAEDGNSICTEGWCFGNQKEGLVICIQHKGNHSTQLSIPILKLLAESLTEKMLQFNLLEELDENNILLSESLSKVKFQNEKINLILQQQEKIIDEKTKDIIFKNKELKEIVTLNAHSVREPLSRIMGLITLLKMNPQVHNLAEIKLMADASEDLDSALREIIKRAEQN